MRKLVLLFVAAGLTLASCEKDDETYDPIDASKVKLLMNGTWQLKSYMVNPDVEDELSFPVDEFESLPGCKKDDFYTFKNSNTFFIFEGYTKCVMSDPDSVEIHYRLEDSENKIIAWSNPDDMENSIVMEGEMKYPSVDSFIYTYRSFNEETELTSEHVKIYVDTPRD